MLEVASITGSRYFNNDSVGRIRFKSIPTDLNTGDVIVFSNGSKILLHTNVNSSTTATDITGEAYSILSPHYVCFKAGFKGVVSSVSMQILMLLLVRFLNFQMDRLYNKQTAKEWGDFSERCIVNGCQMAQKAELKLH